MLRQAEKKGDPQLFKSAMKFSNLLFASSNAYKYVSMVVHFMVEGYIASDADIALLEKVLFRKTKHGSIIYMDRSVEWSMKVVCSFLGKFYRVATDNKFKSTISLWNRNAGALFKTSGGSLSTKKSKKNEHDCLEFNSIYIETLVYQDETRV